MSTSTVFSQSYLELRKCLLLSKNSDWNLVWNCNCFVNTVFQQKYFPGNNSLYLSGHHPWSLQLMKFDAGAEHNIGFVSRIKSFLALCHLLNYGVAPSFDIVPQQVSLHFMLQWKWQMWANAVFFITHLDIFRQKIKTDFWCPTVLKVLSKTFERWMAFYCRRSRTLLHTWCQLGTVHCVPLCRKVFVSIYPLTFRCRPSTVESDSCQYQLALRTTARNSLKLFFDCERVVATLMTQHLCWPIWPLPLFTTPGGFLILTVLSCFSHVSFSNSSSRNADELRRLQVTKSNWKQSWRFTFN